MTKIGKVYILEPGHVVAYVIAFGVIPGAHVYSDMQCQSLQKCLEKTFFVGIFVWKEVFRMQQYIPCEYFCLLCKIFIYPD